MAGTITSAGLGSGLDVNKIVTQLIQADRKPTANKLAGEQAQVNGKLSALSSLKGALSTFSDTLGKLEDSATFQVRSAQSSNSDRFTASAQSTASPGSYSIEVDALAKAQKLSSTGYADGAAVGTGTLNIEVDGDSTAIAIDSGNNTLAGIRDAINDAADNPGVSATLIHANDGAHLQILSNDTGLANAATLSTSGADAALDDFVNGVTATTDARDASIKIDGFTHTDSSNTISDAIKGVTFNLASAEPGTTDTLTVKLDQGAAKEAVSNFVKSYNKLTAVVDALSSYDQDSGRAGPLLGDTTLQAVTRDIRQQLGKVTGGSGEPIRALANIGVSFQLDGKLALDGDKLQTALNTHFDAVGDLFAGQQGYATSLGNLLDGYLDGDGIFEARTDGLKNHLERIATQRRDLDQRLAAKQKNLLARFSALDTLVSQMKNQGDFLSRQFAALSNNGSKQ